jgi:hypothetical protein
MGEISLVEHYTVGGAADAEPHPLTKLNPAAKMLVHFMLRCEIIIAG